MKKSEDKSVFDLLMEYQEGAETAEQLRRIILKLAELLGHYTDWSEDLTWITCETALAYVQSQSKEDEELEAFEAHCLSCKFCASNQLRIINLIFRLSPAELKQVINDVLGK